MVYEPAEQAAASGLAHYPGFALHKKSLVIQNLSDTDCGLPPHRAERLGLSGSNLLPNFPEAQPQEKVIKKNLAESHRHSALCGGKPQTSRCPNSYLWRLAWSYFGKDSTK